MKHIELFSFFEIEMDTSKTIGEFFFQISTVFQCFEIETRKRFKGA